MKKGLTILKLHNHIVFCEYMQTIAREHYNLIEAGKWKKYEEKAEKALTNLIIWKWNL